MKSKYRWFAEYGKPNYWNKLSLSTFKSIPFLFRLYYDLNDNKLRKFLKMKKGKIVDLGCGNGRFLAYADLGVDFSKGMLERAKRKGKCLVLASILHLPFKDESFDTAFMADVSIIIKPTERKEAYNEAKRVAKSFYDFLDEDRTVMPFIMSVFRGAPLPITLTAYLALLLCFPIDRVRRLGISHGHFAC
jgi:SAM-dependent methyltransferase